jgi:hypothetical protein
VLLCPTFTFPKFKVCGDIARPDSIPVPVKEIEAGELDASLTIENVPLSTPAESGAN